MSVEKFVSLVLIAVVDNRTVIAGKDQDGVVCDVEAVQCVHDFTYGPVQLQDDVATSAESAFACETWVGECAVHVRLAYPYIRRRVLPDGMQ